MRVALVLWDGGLGGAETLSIEIARAMRARGVDARIVFIGGAKVLRGRLVAHDVPYAEFGAATGRESLFRKRELAALVLGHGSAGCIANGNTLMPLAIRLGGYRAPMLAVEHGGMLNPQTQTKRQRLARHVERFMTFGWSYVCVSHYMGARFNRSMPFASASVIYNGVDLRRFYAGSPRTAPHNVVVGVASRLVTGKGLETLIDAVIRTPEEVTVRIAGDGPLRSSLISQAAQQGVAGRIELVGVVDDIAGFWRECDIAVVPSDGLRESFSMAAVEAMATGLPVVGVAAGALPEVIGPAGRLVPPRDPALLGSVLSDLAADPRERQRLGALARARAEDLFDINTTVDRYLAQLQNDGRSRPLRLFRPRASRNEHVG